LASALFGLAHRMTWSYALSAGAIGAWLGLLFLLTGDLVAPAAAHAFYDFVALVYYLRFFSPKPRGVKL
jgi:membrane protease YdiL (CAAX protease family)